jgi:threonine/homoserine/homoserine lactone efflux protein
MLPPLPELLLFVGAGLALNVTPGPDMMYVTARGVSQGRRAGIASALGIGAGTLFHITFVAFGLTSLLAAVPAAYTVIRLAGAAYLAYLGVQALRSTGEADERPLARGGDAAAFRQGVLTNVLNPKVAMFFLAFLPQFVDPSRGNTALQVIALGLLFDTTGTIVNVIVAVGASRLASRLRGARRTRLILDRLCGALFIGLGLRLALASRK